MEHVGDHLSDVAKPGYYSDRFYFRYLIGDLTLRERFKLIFDLRCRCRYCMTGRIKG